jgi:hypothetical protein
MKLLTLLLTTLCLFAAPAAAQTIKSLGYNTTNGNIVYTGTNNLNFTNYVYFDSDTSIGGSAGELRWGGVVAFELETMMFERPLSFNGTAGGETRTNLGLGATWLTNTDVTNFRSAIGLGATNFVLFAGIGATNGADISGQGIFYDGILLAEQATIDFGDAVATTRTNLGLPLPALTNTSNATMMRALAGSTNTNEPYSGVFRFTDPETEFTYIATVSNGIILRVEEF